MQDPNDPGAMNPGDIDPTAAPEETAAADAPPVAPEHRAEAAMVIAEQAAERAGDHADMAEKAAMSAMNPPGDAGQTIPEGTPVGRLGPSLVAPLSDNYLASWPSVENALHNLAIARSNTRDALENLSRVRRGVQVAGDHVNAAMGAEREAERRAVEAVEAHRVLGAFFIERHSAAKTDPSA